MRILITKKIQTVVAVFVLMLVNALPCFAAMCEACTSTPEKEQSLPVCSMACCQTGAHNSVKASAIEIAPETECCCTVGNFEVRATPANPPAHLSCDLSVVIPTRWKFVGPINLFEITSFELVTDFTRDHERHPDLGRAPPFSVS